MPAKSKRSSTPKNNRPTTNSSLSRPIAAGILAKATSAVGEYQIIVSQEDDHWYGHGLELPHVFGDGPSPAACIAETREALITAVAYFLEKGQSPPAPARMGKRTQQVNVRLTPEEKVILEGTARRKGFEGLSDFIRAAALESVR